MNSLTKTEQVLINLSNSAYKAPHNNDLTLPAQLACLIDSLGYIPYQQGVTYTRNPLVTTFEIVTDRGSMTIIVNKVFPSLSKVVVRVENEKYSKGLRNIRDIIKSAKLMVNILGIKE